MRITNVQLNAKGLSVSNSISFKSPYVNGNYYTDREYIDAVNNKHIGRVDHSNFSDRYGFFTYVFTSAADNHATEVNKCIDDLKAEETKGAQARAQELQKQAEERKKLEVELQKARNLSLQREHALQRAMRTQKNQGLKRLILPKKILDELVENVVNPFAIDNLNKENGWVTEVPNGVLLYSSSSRKNMEVIKALAEQILQDKFQSNFYTFLLENNNYHEIEKDLNRIKIKAEAEYNKIGQRSIIFIPNFDKIALEYDNPNYNPRLNDFLKIFFLDCANRGCTIFSTAQNINRIEEAFIINKQRFTFNINLRNYLLKYTKL